MNGEDYNRPFSGSDLKMLWRLRFLWRPLRVIILGGALLVFLGALSSVLLPYATMGCQVTLELIKMGNR